MIRKLINFTYRNRRSLGDQKTIKRTINLEWWNYSLNLGDTLAIVVYEWMLKERDYDKNKKISRTTHLMTIGSLIGMENFDSIIWGSGIHCFQSIKTIADQRWYRKYDIRAVRGPITRMILKTNGYNCPEIYGDPAVLMPMIYKNPCITKKYKYSLILHFSQSGENLPDQIHLINIKTDNYKFFIDELLSSEIVISSSLHGIILSEAYGIHAIFLKEGMDDELIKFYDWYYSTRRMNVVIANSIEEALQLKPMDLPDLRKMQKDIRDSFPYELWKS